MTVYVDDFRVPATVGGWTARWSHLTADTQDELHEFAASIGLRSTWFQEKCRTRCAPEGQPCPHWHYDVTDSKRDLALAMGAKSITLRQMGEIIRARRVATRGGS